MLGSSTSSCPHPAQARSTPSHPRLQFAPATSWLCSCQPAPAAATTAAATAAVAATVAATCLKRLQALACNGVCVDVDVTLLSPLSSQPTPCPASHTTPVGQKARNWRELQHSSAAKQAHGER